MDEELGVVEDLYFDDKTWTIRYVVLDTGRWLPGRLVLLAPEKLDTPEFDEKRIHAGLTREQVSSAPGAEADRPVSRQHQIDLAEHYGWVPYWVSSQAYGLGGMAAPTGAPVSPEPGGENQEPGPEQDDPDLRSVREVCGYHIRARDGEIGHVEDFVVDMDGWTLRYLVVDTRNWLPGSKVAASLEWIVDVDWAQAEVEVDLTKEQIRTSPPVESGEWIGRDYERKLHKHYGREGYWE